jgi:hypothetical protein
MEHKVILDQLFRQARGVTLLIAISLGLCLSGQAQTAGLNTSSTGEFLAYTCTFNGGTGLAEVHAAVTGPDGLPLNSQTYTLDITNSAGESLPSDAASVSAITERPPVRIILVMDTTSTVPINEVRNAIRDHLLPRLALQDEMALLQFDTTIAPMTQFYTDKNALYNEHIADIQLREGDNRLYDALLQAVTLTQPNSPTRQVILLLTDSRRGATAQAPQSDIITRAQASKTQIFAIGFEYEDTPDQDELFAIADGTDGRGWVYAGERTRSLVEQAIGTSLESFVTALNTEVTISVNIAGQTPDESGLVPLNVSLLPTGGGAALTDTVSCPTTEPAPEGTQSVEPTRNFSIAFANIVNNLVVNEPLNVEVSAQPEDIPLELRFVFWLDDEMDDQFPDGIYILDTSSLAPGNHTLRAQLRDGADNVVASTPTVNLYVQRELQLSLAGASTTNLSGPVQFNAAGANGLPSVEFVAASAANPTVTQPLGTVQVAEDGTAALPVSNIQQEAQRLFPNQETWELQVTARAPGENGAQPLAVSNTLPITVAAVAQAAALPTGLFLPLGLSLVLVVLNYGLLRQIRNARIRRFIDSPGSEELGPELMSITVNRAGMKQTYTLTKKTMFVGRGSGNDISLEDDSNVSRQHGVILWRRGRWWFANRKPKVKTKIDGKLYRGYARRKLQPMSEIQIGDFQLVFHSNAQRDMSDLIKTNL